jgi:hypothetical protein
MHALTREGAPCDQGATRRRSPSDVAGKKRHQPVLEWRDKYPGTRISAAVDAPERYRAVLAPHHEQVRMEVLRQLQEVYGGAP